jgi:hypothetical protein
MNNLAASTWPSQARRARVNMLAVPELPHGNECHTDRTLRVTNEPAPRAPSLIQYGSTRRRLAHVAESNYGSSPYHLGAWRSMRVVDAAQRFIPVIFGRCRTVRLLHFAAALLAVVDT